LCILDPDGYWIEVISRDETSPVTNEFTLAQTMIRVKDPVKSLRFYCELLGMTQVKEAVYSDFSLYFLAHLNSEDAAVKDPRMIYPPVLELTHNHGTESNPEFRCEEKRRSNDYLHH
jgi:lactoylglutathione lyase